MPIGNLLNFLKEKVYENKENPYEIYGTGLEVQTSILDIIFVFITKLDEAMQDLYSKTYVIFSDILFNLMKSNKS